MAFVGGHDWDTIQNTLHAWVVNGSGLTSSRVRWAGQDAPRSDEPGISMRLSIFDDAQSWVDHEVNHITFDDIAVTAVDAGTNTFEAVGHARQTGDGAVRLESDGDVPANTAEDTNYWVIRVDDDHFQLAETFADAMNGVAVDLGDEGTGNITLVDTATTLRAGEEIVFLARATVHATLTLECYTSEGVGMDMATAILNRVRSRSLLPSQQDLLQSANIGLLHFERVFALGSGTRDAFLFEPRASLQVLFALPSEESETGTIIETTEILNQITDQTSTVGD